MFDSSIVLIRPQIEVNLGSVARSMGNFGLKDLRIVSPLCDYLGNVSLATSCNFSQILYNSKVYSNISDSISEFNVVFALSHRKRSIYKEYVSSREIDLKSNKKYAFLFGPESSGLTNDDIMFADKIIYIDTLGSMNLSHCVSILCYELFLKNRSEFEFKNEDLDKKNKIESIANKQDLNYLYEYIYNICGKSSKIKNALLSFISVLIRSNSTKKEIKSIYGLFNYILNIK